MANEEEKASTPEAVVKLVENDEVAAACESVETWAKDGRWADVASLAAALEAASPSADSKDAKQLRGRFEAVVDHLEGAVALVPGEEAIGAVLALTLQARERSLTTPRTRSMRVAAFASRLGYGQTADAFLTALDRVTTDPKTGDVQPEHQELFACWMQEIVLRNRSLEDEPRARRFKAALAASGHPLAGLPLALRPAEREAPSYMPLYGDRGLGRAIDTLTSGSMSIRTIPPPADGAEVRATVVNDTSVTDRMSAAVRPWSDGRSGKVESKVFLLEPSVDAGVLGSWLLRTLPLASTGGVTRLDCSRTGAEGVFGPLFSAASNGGASGPGLGGAYGRLAAWTSLAALVGVTADTASPVEAADERAGRCSYLTFRGPGPWFHDVAWDLGVLALRPDGASVAVLAATDNE